MTEKNPKSTMKHGDALEPGEELVSPSGVFKLRYEKEGNLELLAKQPNEQWISIWQSRTKPKNPGPARFDAADLLVVCDEDGSELRPCKPWRSPADPLAARLVLQDDGNLVAYETSDPYQYPYWSTDTWNGRFAVLIGVEEYSHFSEERLRAGRNDVLAMWKVCRRLGYQPEHIRLRTSPRLTKGEMENAEVERLLALPEGLGKTDDDVRPQAMQALASAQGSWAEILGDATCASIADALLWLRSRLAAPFDQQQGYVVPGILYYSGHGAKLDGELALCPSDVGRDGTNALPFADVEEALTAGYERQQSPNPMEHLTVVLDCCFAAADSKKGGATNQRVTALDLSGGAPSASRSPQRPVHPWLQRRIFCATRDDEQGHQALLGDRWHGAFTWALTRTLEQWTTRQSSTELFPYVDISHAELLMRTRMLLEALSFPQHPVLMDAFANTPVFWSGLARVEAQAMGPIPGTSARPTAWRPGIQLTPIGNRDNPFMRLEFLNGQTLLYEGILPKETTTTTTNETWTQGKEYWRKAASGTPNFLRVTTVVATALTFRPSEYTEVNQNADWGSRDQIPALTGSLTTQLFGVSLPSSGAVPTWFGIAGGNLLFQVTTYSLTAHTPERGYFSKATPIRG